MCFSPKQRACSHASTLPTVNRAFLSLSRKQTDYVPWVDEFVAKFTFQISFNILTKHFRANRQDIKKSYKHKQLIQHVCINCLCAVAVWPVTGQGFQNTKWPAVLYYQ